MTCCHSTSAILQIEQTPGLFKYFSFFLADLMVRFFCLRLDAYNFFL